MTGRAGLVGDAGCARGAAPAAAAPLKPCRDDKSARCGAIAVPVHRSDPHGPKLKVRFRVFPRSDRSRPPARADRGRRGRSGLQHDRLGLGVRVHAQRRRQLAAGRAQLAPTPSRRSPSACGSSPRSSISWHTAACAGPRRSSRTPRWRRARPSPPCRCWCSTAISTRSPPSGTPRRRPRRLRTRAWWSSATSGT
jgi:hypothetical protein